MNSFENVAKELEKIFQSIERGYSSYTFSMMITNKGIKDISQRLYKTLFYWITDPIQTPDRIIYMLDSYLPKLDGFSTKKGSQNLVAFFCLRALAKRKPVLNGLWKNIIYIIMKYSKDFDQTQIKSLVNAKKDGKELLEDIKLLCSPKQCPDPWLGLEIIRLTSLFSPVFGQFNYDQDSFRELVINTLCHGHDTNISPIFDDLFHMSTHDLRKMIEENYIDIDSIMQRDNPESRQIEIIGAVVKVTKKFALAEGDSNNLNIYLRFCGLISAGIDEHRHIQYFIKAVHDKPNLIEYFMDTYNSLNDSFGIDGEFYYDDYPLCNSTELRDAILNMFFKHYVRIFPMHQSLMEVNGGITPVAQYKVRYFSDNHQPSGCKAYSNYGDSTTDESDDSEYYY